MALPPKPLKDKFCKTTGEKKLPQPEGALKQKGCAACDCKKSAPKQ